MIIIMASEDMVDRPCSAPTSASGGAAAASVVDFLRQECGVCSRCISCIITDHHHAGRHVVAWCDGSGASSSDSDVNDGYNCTVCFGLSSPSYQKEFILPAIKEALSPYCQSRRSDTDRAAESAASDAAADGTAITNDDETPLIDANQGNHLMRESPTANLPWLIAVRAHCAIASAKWFMANNNNNADACEVQSAEAVYLRIKEHLRSSLRGMILDASITSLDDKEGLSENKDRVELSEQLHKEEAGYLGIHISCLPALSTPQTTTSEGSTLTNLLPIPPSFHSHLQKNMQQIQQSHYRILNPRKRFRGNDPTLKQGGDPRTNLELRIRRFGSQKSDDAIAHNGGQGSSKRYRVNKDVPSSSQSKEEQELNNIVSWLEKSTVLQWIEKESSSVQEAGIGNDRYSELITWLQQFHQQYINPSQPNNTERKQECSIHVAAWRRPLYVQGTYTKSRRNISQTPFYVPSTSPKANKPADIDGKAAAKAHNASSMVRKGVSSVEEEICPPLALVGCGGISIQNNEDVLPSIFQQQQQQVNSCEKGAIVYGMCKFHASGREDMDVRMLLPPPSIVGTNNGSITGRPFVCEVFDAHRIPSEEDLSKVVMAINKVGGIDEKGQVATAGSCHEETTMKEIEMNEKGWPTTLVQPNRYHGNNPNGVGVSRPLTLVPSSAYSGLQSQTEEKVKHYGCVCWTSVPIASQEELVEKLGCLHWNKECSDDETPSRSINYPLEIKQSTPLRVLHRRASDIRSRFVLSLSACRIDDHWFRLRMSTSAGTYVKEFVHGDCGRTRPSVASMLGGRADITELDCEGIAV